jgi:hypothetical protein
LNIRIYLTALLICLFSFVLNGQVAFQQLYRGIQGNQGSTIIQLNNGNYTLSSYRGLFNLDSDGNINWTKSNGFAGAFYFCQTVDNGYAYAGYIATDSGDVNILTKTDSAGNALWTKQYGHSNSYGQINSIQSTSDGGFILCGYAYTTGTIDDILLIKTNAFGDTLWTKMYGGIHYDVGYSVLQVADGGYAITGFIENEDSSWNRDVCLTRTDSVGTLLWSKVFGGAGWDWSSSVQRTFDDGYIIAGLTYSFGVGMANGVSDFYLIKTDAGGNLQWSKTYGSGLSEGISDVKQTMDGGYILAGNSGTFYGNHFAYNIKIIKTNNIGDTIWTKGFGVDGSYYNDRIGKVELTSDGGFIFTGSTSSFGTGLYDLYLIKLDSNGNGSCNELVIPTIITNPATVESNPVASVFSTNAVIINYPVTTDTLAITDITLCYTNGIAEISSNSSIIISPNPSNGIFHLQITNDVSSAIKTISIFNSLGQAIESISINENETIFNLSNYPKGIYFVKIAQGSKTTTQKIVLM